MLGTHTEGPPHLAAGLRVSWRAQHASLAGAGRANRFKQRGFARATRTMACAENLALGDLRQQSE